MKKLLFGLLLVPTLCFAETWILKNKGGGEITLTKETCKADNGAYPSLSHAYTWTNEMYQEGCWLVMDGNVHIIWVNKDNSRDRRVYPIDSFHKKENY